MHRCLLYVCKDQIFEKVLETHPQYLKSFTEAMEGMAHADMDCLGLADFTGVRDVVDLGGKLLLA